ncbi:MAG: hypothetical protein U9Q00_00555 [Synergistota bacterium]|nr:hypothetical protein [Synergistota bacterium]
MAGILEDIRVISFVGPAGTGKSLRAQFVAREKEIDFIIDDGLVIHRGRIVAGKSAKTEKNMVRAIRRAMFLFPDHRAEVIKFLERNSPCSLMVIATSKGMAEKICCSLGMKSPELFIDIADIVSPEDIARAQYERKHKKQHVIPVSQAQIRKNYTGKLVGRLKNLLRLKDNYEKTIVRPPFSFYGDIKIESDAVVQITRHVLSSYSKVNSVDDVQVKDLDGSSVDIVMNLSVILSSQPLLSIAGFLSRRVKLTVEFLCGLEVRRVDVNIDKVVSKDV